MSWLRFSVLAALAFMSASAPAADMLYDGFREPPASARPFVRWWWNGNCPTEEDIARQLDALRDGGIGGVEINPIAMPGGEEAFAEANAVQLEWLSPEWNRIVRFTCDEAKKRGMMADLIVGSGWPFGGEFIKPGEQIQVVIPVKKQITGPTVFRTTTKQLFSEAQLFEAGTTDLPASSMPRSKLMFLRLVPDGQDEFSPGVELLGLVQPDGTVQLDIPEGSYTLYAGVLTENFRQVSRGAKGAAGPVLDHLNQPAVEKYLNNMSDKLGPALGGKLGDGLRAMFCDSIELSGANWTTDFPTEFEKRRGYRIEQYLPFVLDANSTQAGGKFADTVRRARYDFYKTFAELFHERFAMTYHRWCHDNGVKSRYQANGNPWHIDMLNGFMIPDIPEGDGWIISGEEPFEPQRTTEIHFRIWNKTASSAAHLAGKSVVSCESMTNTIGVWWETLEYLMESDNLNFVSGVNHSVLHGYNYSPKNVPFPGWIQYGTYFSERNSWWPYFRRWTDRNARLSYVFQNSTHKAQVAILAPTADLWSDHGLSKFKYVDYIAYLYPLWHALNHNGFSTDYVSEKMLQGAAFDANQIHIGEQSYEAIIVPDACSIELKTIQAVRMLAVNGGRVVFIGDMPHRSPGMLKPVQNDLNVEVTARHSMRDPNRTVAVRAPEEKHNLIDWTGWMMKKVNLAPAVEISNPNDKLLHVRYSAGDRDIYFFASVNRTEPIAFKARFNTVGDKTPCRWDAETGERTLYPHGGKKTELDIRLEPLESLLLVFEPNTDARPYRRAPESDSNDFCGIESAWQAEFTHCVTGEKFSRKFDKLANFADANGDPQVFTFAGAVVYRAEFDAADTSRTMLDLGNVYDISEATLNGKPLGVRWWGRHTYDATGVLKKGRNTLEVKVTTVLANYARSLKDNREAMRYAFWYPPRPAGLAGPVRLLKVKAE